MAVGSAGAVWVSAVDLVIAVIVEGVVADLGDDDLGAARVIEATVGVAGQGAGFKADAGAGLPTEISAVGTADRPNSSSN